MNTNCTGCGRKLTDPIHVAEGIGPVCKAKLKRRAGSEPEKPTKVFYMSGPNRTREQIRSYLVRVPGEPSALVRIEPDGKTRLVRCDCTPLHVATHCKHIKAVDPIDKEKFKI